jgi:U-box domain
MALIPPPPSDFVCPLSKQVMQDPVETPDGLNYERIAIEGWLRLIKSCPVNGTPLTVASLKANTSLQWKIRYWQWRNKATEEANDAEQQQEKASPSTSLTSTNIPPQRFTCPLTNELMTDPVLSKTGYSFERVALLQWLVERGNVCPVSGQDLPLSHVVTNATLHHEIQGWKKQQQQEAMSRLYPVVQPVPTTMALQVQEKVSVVAPNVPPTTPVESSLNKTTIVLPTTKTMSSDTHKPTGIMPPNRSNSTMSMMKNMLLHMQVPPSNNSNDNTNRTEAETLFQSGNQKETIVLDVLRQVELTLGEN